MSGYLHYLTAREHIGDLERQAAASRMVQRKVREPSGQRRIRIPHLHLKGLRRVASPTQ